MAIRKSQQKSVNKYISSHYDRINLTLPKGKKQDIADIAKKIDESTNTFINKAIEERIARLSIETTDIDGG